MRAPCPLLVKWSLVCAHYENLRDLACASPLSCLLELYLEPESFVTFSSSPHPLLFSEPFWVRAVHLLECSSITAPPPPQVYPQSHPPHHLLSSSFLLLLTLASSSAATAGPLRTPTLTQLVPWLCSGISPGHTHCGPLDSETVDTASARQKGFNGNSWCPKE